MSSVESIPFLLFLLPLALAAGWDVAHYRIPNWIVALHLGAFLVALPLMAAPSPGGHAAAGGIGLAIGAALFALRAVGGGDAKLLASVALWSGLDGLLPLIIATAMIGGLLAIVLLVLRPLTMGVLTALPNGRAVAVHMPRLLQAGQPIPYGVAIAAGGLVAAVTGGTVF